MSSGITKAAVGSLAAMLVLGACSSDTPTPAASTTPSTPAATGPTTPAPTESEPSSTFDTTGMEGAYAGSWTNTTFGSTGAASAELSFPDASTFAVTIDLAGGVFGEQDPDPFDISGAFTRDGANLSGSSDLLGDFTFTIDASGAFTIDAPDVPSERIGAMTVTGNFSRDGISGSYNVTFPEGGGADGTFELTKG